MKPQPRKTIRRVTPIILCAVLLSATSLIAQTPWIHVEVTEADDDSHVKVNLPLSVVEIALEVAPEKFIENGRVKIEHMDADIDVADLRRLWQALRDSGEAEFVTVEKDDETVSVRRQGDLLLVHVDGQKTGDPTKQVRVEVPVSVVDALFESDSDELNVADAIAQLKLQRGDLVRVDDGDSKVRVWIDER